MKKYIRVISATICVILITIALCSFSFADGNVTYKGQSEKFIFAPGSDYSPTDLFDNFKGVLPGDERTQQIVVKNEKSNNVKIVIYMKSTGAWDDSEEFLSQLKLTVKSGDNSLFDATADKTAGLTDWVAIGTFEPGAEAKLDLVLKVPADLDNKFQDTVGKLDWQFKVEELPADKPAPVTGEAFNYKVIIIVALCAFAVMVSVVAVVISKRKKNEKA